jgi:hypothetical protein
VRYSGAIQTLLSDEIPELKEVPMGGWSRTLIGLFTLAAMVVGGWYVLNLVKKGDLEKDEIRLILRVSDAHGVPVGGAVRHKGVQVGEVIKVDIAPDDSGVIMELSMGGRFRHTLRKSSRFWIVRPQFSGITQGAFGLDTLIRDPYLEYDTPNLSAPLLLSGSLLFGLNTPPVEEEGPHYRKEASRPSRLTFRVRFRTAQGLREGAPVLYRDLAVGTVLKVDLSLDGRSVEANVQINGRYRETVRSDSIFWVARPNVEFGFHWPSLVNVRDLSKMVTGAALAYVTPTASRQPPLKEGEVLEGRSEAPDESETYEGPLVSIEPAAGEDWPSGIFPHQGVVGVSFAFTEVDLFQDTKYLFEGTGLLFQNTKGEHLILTAKTLAQGSYSASDYWGDADIKDPDLKVIFADRTVHEAGMVWTDPNDRDLALLALPQPPAHFKKSQPRFSEDGTTEEYYMLVAFRLGEKRMIRSQPIPADRVLDPGKPIRRFHPDLKLRIKEWCGALLLDHQSRIVGMVGREEPLSDRAAVMVLLSLPEPEKE